MSKLGEKRLTSKGGLPIMKSNEHKELEYFRLNVEFKL